MAACALADEEALSPVLIYSPSAIVPVRADIAVTIWISGRPSRCQASGGGCLCQTDGVAFCQIKSPAPSLSLPGQPSHNGGSEEICRPNQGPESDQIARSSLMKYRFSP